MLLRRVLREILVALHLVRRPRYVVRFSYHQPSSAEIGISEIIAVWGQGGAKWACLLCPCGSREVVRLALNRKTHPRWSLTVDCLGRPSLRPSVWQRERCQCHFWITAGQINWCKS